MNFYEGNIFWNIISKKYSKKVNFVFFFFLTKSLLMDKVIKNKRGTELATSGSSDYKPSAEKCLFGYILSHQVWCNVKLFLCY